MPLFNRNNLLLWFAVAAFNLVGSFKHVDATVFNASVSVTGPSPVILPAGTDQIYGDLVPASDGTVGFYIFLYILDHPATVTIEAKDVDHSTVDMAMLLLDAVTFKQFDSDDDNEGNCTATSTLGPLDSCFTVSLPPGAYLIYAQDVDNSMGTFVINISVPSGEPPSTSKPTPAVIKPTPKPVVTAKPKGPPVVAPTKKPVVTAAPIPLQPTVFNETVDPGIDPLAVVILPRGTTQVNSELAISGGDYNTYLYVLDQPATVTIEVKSEDSSLDPFLLIIDALTLRSIDTDNNDKRHCTSITTLGPMDACLTIHLPAGQYHIVVSGIDTSTGDYVINFSVPSAGLPVTSTPTPKPVKVPVVKRTVKPVCAPTRKSKGHSVKHRAVCPPSK